MLVVSHAYRPLTVKIFLNKVTTSQVTTISAHLVEKVIDLKQGPLQPDRKLYFLWNKHVGKEVACYPLTLFWGYWFVEMLGLKSSDRDAFYDTVLSFIIL